MFFHARKVRTLPASFFQLPRYTFFVRLSCFKYIRLCARPQPRAPRRSRATRARRSRRPGSHRAQPCAARRPVRSSLRAPCAACAASAPCVRRMVAACSPRAPVPSVARPSRRALPSRRADGKPSVSTGNAPPITRNRARRPPVTPSACPPARRVNLCRSPVGASAAG